MSTYWQEPEQTLDDRIADDITDLSYRITCPRLPMDHAHELRAALSIALPWIEDDPDAGIHSIHGASSGNGWFRPDHPDTALLQLSRRARMVLRLPRTRLAAAAALSGMTLDVGGYPLRVGEWREKPLSVLTTLFARQVISPDTDENAFVEHSVAELALMGVRVRKLLCGRAGCIRMPDRQLRVRSLMLADLEISESMLLQQRGLGPGRKLGCGLFLPHKGIKAVVPKDED